MSDINETLVDPIQAPLTFALLGTLTETLCGMLVPGELALMVELRRILGTAAPTRLRPARITGAPDRACQAPGNPRSGTSGHPGRSAARNIDETLTIRRPLSV